MHFSLKRLHGLSWQTGVTLEKIREELAAGTIDEDWLVCPLGEAERAVTVGELLADPDLLVPTSSTATLAAPSDRESLGEDVTPVAGENPFDRRHDLDALRAIAMLLGIILHGALAYTTFPHWPVRNEETSVVFDVLFGSIHGFRMPLFFVLSGFFTAMLWRKRGLRSLVRHRTLRIAVPLALFTLTVVPLGHFVVEQVSKSEREKERAMAEGEGVEKRSDTIWAAAKHDDLEALRAFLEESGESINAPDPATELTPLHWSALSGSTEAARLLVAAGAHVNAKIKDGSTALHHAAFMGHPDIASLFIENGAEVNLVNSLDSTPFDISHAGWGMAKYVADILDLEAAEETREEGCEAVRDVLRQAGGKPRRELEGAQVIQLGDGNDGGALESLRRAYRGWIWTWTMNGNVFHHLWFLWFLCLLLIPFLAYAALANAFNWQGPPPALFRQPWVFLWIIPLTMIPILFNRNFGPDSAAGWVPPPHILVLYAVYFFFGALYFDCNDREGRLFKGWFVLLPVGLIVLFPLASALNDKAASGSSLRLLAMLAEALYAWFLIFGLMGLFRKVCARESKALRYVSDSAYWLYIAHLVVLYYVQSLFNPLPIGPFAKFTLVCLVTTAFLFLSYELFIRYTPIGTLLNGKRRRPSKKSPSPPGAAVQNRS